jgi:hypothetical protein
MLSPGVPSSVHACCLLQRQLIHLEHNTINIVVYFGTEEAAAEAAAAAAAAAPAHSP